ncbi:MAG: hypothetical protein QOI80_3829 [Solirubrobacteraceae bacterium]|jgi:hypothetical protein|nr:hypothetical protein [Solirubrobacteraceae bacterium]
MTQTNRPLPSRAARRRHASDYSDAVVAAYIHDISARRRYRAPAASSTRAPITSRDRGLHPLEQSANGRPVGLLDHEIAGGH